MKNLLNKILLLLLAVFVSSCLTTEYKEYRFKFNADGSGSGSIKYVNIVSQEDEEKDVSFSDFGEVIDDYLEGTTFEDENPTFSVTNKELFEENGVLCGRVEFTFESFSDAGFVNFVGCECAPILYYMGSLSETFSESDGKYLGDSESLEFPVISWNNGTKEVYFKTVVQEDLADCHSLLPLYKTWKDSQ